MKAIIFSVSVVFLSLTANAQNAILNPICSNNPLSYTRSKIVGVVENNCPGKFPVKALETIFKNEFKEIHRVSSDPKFASLEVFKYTYAPQTKTNHVMFQTTEHAYYVYPDEKGGDPEIVQGTEDSECHYKFNIEQKAGKRYCTPTMPRTASQKCLDLRARDRVFVDENKKEVACDAFIEAMVSCSKDAKGCSKGFAAVMDSHDKPASKPLPSPYNKPAPSSTRR